MNFKRTVTNAITAISSNAALPKIVAGLSVAIAVVKLLAAIEEFKGTKSAGQRIGFN